MDDEDREVAVQFQEIFDRHPDPAPLESNLYINERYRGKVIEGIRHRDNLFYRVESAGMEAVKSYREKNRPPRLLKKRRDQYERRAAEAYDRGAHNFLTDYIVAELAAVNDSAILQDLGRYIQRMLGDGYSVGDEKEKAVIPAALEESAKRLAERGLGMEALAPVILGMALDKSYRPDIKNKSNDAILDGLMESFPPMARQAVAAGVTAELAAREQVAAQHKAALRKAKQDRYAAAGNFLAQEAERRGIIPDQATEMVAQILFRTETDFRSSPEFQEELDHRFGDGFSSGVIVEMDKIVADAAKLRDELDWRARRGGRSGGDIQLP